MDEKIFQSEIDVLKHQREKINMVDKEYNQFDRQIDAFEKKVQEFIKSHAINQASIDKNKKKSTSSEKELSNEDIQNTRKFNELISEAHESGYSNVDLSEVATVEEINEVHSLIRNYYSDFSDQYKLDKHDYAISGIVGTISALIDYFLVTNIKGGNVTSGGMKSGVEKLWSKLLSGEKIKNLEKKYKVSYDISMNTSKISQEVLGLCPAYHRFQSLGHDPILGFLFGIVDLMKGQLTAIDGNGRLIFQSVQGAEYKTFIEAIITVFGHFLSDVTAKSSKGKILSVPAPLTPLSSAVSPATPNRIAKGEAITNSITNIGNIRTIIIVRLSFSSSNVLFAIIAIAFTVVGLIAMQTLLKFI